MEVRPLQPYERQDALSLVLEVFMEFEAPDYSKEGVKNFEKTIADHVWVDTLRFYGAYLEGKLAGVIATRNQGSHIALFFVKGKYHRRGIGRQLFSQMLSHTQSSTITVNSSPFAVEVYKRLGFTPTQEEQTTDGMRYTPMVFTK